MTYDPRGGGNTHIDVVLSQLSVALENKGFVGNRLFPTVNVRKQSDKYYTFGQEAWGIEPGGDFRAPATVANEIPGLAVSLDQYFAVEHALQIAVADEEYENVDSPLQPLQDGTELVTSKILLGRELAMHSLVTTAANYATGLSTTLSGTAQFNDYANSNPIQVIKAGKYAVHAESFVEINTAVIPYEVMTVLEDHPDFIERIKYSERAILTEDIIASVLGIANIIVPGVGYNPSNPGQAVSLGYLWGKDIVLAYVPPRAGLKIPAFAYEFVWGFPNIGQQATERWYEKHRKAEVVRVGRRYDLKLVSKDAQNKATSGYIIKNAVA